jgi:hypothetical protein
VKPVIEATDRYKVASIMKPVMDTSDLSNRMTFPVKTPGKQQFISSLNMPICD